jgi:hypothetical protein
VRRNRVQEHVRLLGILWIAYSTLHGLGAAFILLIVRVVFGGAIHFPNGPSPQIIQLFRPFVTFIALLLFAKAAAGFIAGCGLLQRQEWARILALVVGFLALLNVPIGTAIGIYTLWVLLPTQSDTEYKTLSAAA